ncbi:MAG: tetratricopeptide repeat protein [Bacteriovoracia bacterium]
MGKLRAGFEQIEKSLATRDFQTADQLIREQHRREPDSADSHYFLGVLAYHRGDLGKTIEHLRQALHLDPKHTDAAICLSVLYNDIAKYDDAKKAFKMANQSVAHTRTGDDPGIDRQFAVKHLEIADLYFRYRRYDEAVEEYNKAALLDPVDLEIQIRRAKAYAKKGYITRAIQDLQTLRDTHPRALPIRIQLGLLHYSQGNVLDAELEWEAARDIEPNNSEVYSYLEMAKTARIGGGNPA